MNSLISTDNVKAECSIFLHSKNYTDYPSTFKFHLQNQYNMYEKFRYDLYQFQSDCGYHRCIESILDFLLYNKDIPDRFRPILIKNKEFRIKHRLDSKDRLILERKESYSLSYEKRLKLSNKKVRYRVEILKLKEYTFKESLISLLEKLNNNLSEFLKLLVSKDGIPLEEYVNNLSKKLLSLSTEELEKSLGVSKIKL